MGYYLKEEAIKNDFNMIWDVIKKNHFEVNEDLFQVGCIGLLKAARKFDPDKEYKFSTFAYRCIKNEILMHLRKQNKSIQPISLEEQLENAQSNKYSIEIYNHNLYHVDDYSIQSIDEIIKEAICRSCQSQEDQTIFLMIYKRKFNGEMITQAKMAEIYHLSPTRISRNVKKINSEVKRLLKENAY